MQKFERSVQFRVITGIKQNEILARWRGPRSAQTNAFPSVTSHKSQQKQTTEEGGGEEGPAAHLITKSVNNCNGLSSRGEMPPNGIYTTRKNRTMNKTSTFMGLGMGGRGPRRGSDHVSYERGRAENQTSKTTFQSSLTRL
jgi:hypothetical protein